jgi:hypothetical protein
MLPGTWAWRQTGAVQALARRTAYPNTHQEIAGAPVVEIFLLKNVTEFVIHSVQNYNREISQGYSQGVQQRHATLEDRGTFFPAR